MDSLVQIVGRAAFLLFRAYFELIETVIRPLIPNFKLPAVLGGEDEQNIDDRISKIGRARENLQDAILAVDELRRQADDNKAALQEAMQQISDMEREKAAVHTELGTLRQVAAADTDAFRRIVGIPRRSDIWRERGIGFASGVIASVVASVIFLGLQGLFGQ